MRFLFPFIYFIRVKAYLLLFEWLMILVLALYLCWTLNQYMNGLEYAFRIHHLGSPEETGLQDVKLLFRIGALFLVSSLYLSGGFLIKGQVGHEASI